MSTSNNEDNNCPKAGDRHLKMFERHCQGATHEEIAEEFQVSVSWVYKIAAKYKWSRYKASKEEEEHKRIAMRVKAQLAKAAQPVYVDCWVEDGLKLPPGVKHSFIIPLDPRFTRNFTHDRETGRVRFERFLSAADQAEYAQKHPSKRNEWGESD